MFRNEIIRRYFIGDILELHVIELNKELIKQGEVEDWIRFFNARTEEDYVWDQGVAEGELLFAELMKHLLSDNRLEDAKLAADDEEARKIFYKEYGIKEE